MKVSLIKDKKMNAVNINMTLEASNFENCKALFLKLIQVLKLRFQI